MGVNVVLLDQLGTTVQGHYLDDQLVTVHLTSTGTATLSSPSSSQSIDSETGQATFANLTFCGDVFSSATLQLDSAGFLGTHCTVNLYGCPDGQMVVNPTDDSTCATCTGS